MTEKRQLGVEQVFTFIPIKREISPSDFTQFEFTQIDKTQDLNIFKLEDEEMITKGSRKRTLDHLSHEEKMLRKKLKNREAAQTSRDKKKARMVELEKTVRLLTKENGYLSSRIEKLTVEKENIERENERLQEELQRVSNKCSLECPVGSAVSLRYPLPKGIFHSRHSFLMLVNLFVVLQHFLRTLTIVGIGYYQIAINSYQIFQNSMTLFRTLTHCPAVQNHRKMNIKWNVRQTWIASICKALTIPVT